MGCKQKKFGHLLTRALRLHSLRGAAPLVPLPVAQKLRACHCSVRAPLASAHKLAFAPVPLHVHAQIVARRCAVAANVASMQPLAGAPVRLLVRSELCGGLAHACAPLNGAGVGPHTRRCSAGRSACGAAVGALVAIQRCLGGVPLAARGAHKGARAVLKCVHAKGVGGFGNEAARRARVLLGGCVDARVPFHHPCVWRGVEAPVVAAAINGALALHV